MIPGSIISSILSASSVASAVLNALTDIAVFEAPYGLLTAQQKAAADTTGGFVAVVASRNSVETSSYAVYSSTSPNGAYSKILDNQAYGPSGLLSGAITVDHQTLSIVDEKDVPASITSGAIALIADSVGQQEFVKLDTLASSPVAGDTVKVLENVDIAIFDSVPIRVSTDETARLYFLSSYSIDPTIKANNDTVYIKVVPKNSTGGELALASITPIPLTITSRAAKPYPVPFIRYRDPASTVGTVFPFSPIPDDELFFDVGSRSKNEVVPTGFFKSTGVIDAGVQRFVAVEGLNGSATPIRILTVDPTTNTVKYSTVDRAADGARQSTIYTIYAEKAGVKSALHKQEILQRPARTNNVDALSLTQSGSNIIAAISTGGATFGNGPEVSIIFVEITGTATVNFDAITLPVGVEKIFVIGNGNYFYLQMPRAQANFNITIPFTGAAGSTLSVKSGGEDTTLTATITTV